MVTIISVKFKPDGRAYYFDPNGNEFHDGDIMVVETSRGVECGYAVGGNRQISKEQITAPLKKVLRPATANDLKRLADN